jgi:uncharacterized protein
MEPSPPPAEAQPRPELDGPAPAATPLLAPVADPERLPALDTLRGVAVLGILLMNILDFGLPEAVESNPLLAGDATVANVAFWLVNQILFEGKMRTIFSMLFGAGAYLLLDRAARRGAGIEAADVYSRRNLWLMAFGMLHAYFLWLGDILFYYGAVGLMLFPFRKLSAPALLAAGGVLLAVTFPQAVLGELANWDVKEKGEAAEAAARAGKQLTEEQAAQRRAWEKKREELYPTEKAIARQIAEYRADYGTMFLSRMSRVFVYESKYFYTIIFFDVAGMMLIGMGLMKLGVLSGERDDRFYRRLLWWGYGVGVPLNTLVGVWAIVTQFDPMRYQMPAQCSYQVGRLSVALGHVAVVMLLCRRGMVPWLTRRLAAAGRMALSNYLLESVVCTTLFYGWGFGLYGQLERYQLLGVVFAVWAFQLLVSPLWLRYFRFGPAEWVWRALTYWRLPPMLMGRHA